MYDLSVIHGLTNHLRKIYKDVVLVNPIQPCSDLSVSSCLPVDGNITQGRAVATIEETRSEGNLVQFTTEDESEKILMKASPVKEAEVLHLCRNANSAETLEVGLYS